MNPIVGQTAIYILVDPRAVDAVRYVGATKVPRVRHLQHCAEGATSPKGEWIESLRQHGIFPQMQIVAWVPDADAVETEKVWIARVRPDFLTNSSTVKSRNNQHNAKAAQSELVQALVTSDTQANGWTTLQAVERAQIEKVLNDTGWNKLETTRQLGIGRQTLYNKIKYYQLVEK
jgi:DNA-binding NtrC family response regulator